jgi:hypothetical protein
VQSWIVNFDCQLGRYGELLELPNILGVNWFRRKDNDFPMRSIVVGLGEQAQHLSQGSQMWWSLDFGHHHHAWQIGIKVLNIGVNNGRSNHGRIVKSLVDFQNVFVGIDVILVFSK